ncbi:hypothetical protein Tco_0783725 [Tanacetum coccineum]
MEIGRNRLKSVENGRNLSKTDEIGRKRTKTVEICQNRLKTVEIGRRWWWLWLAEGGSGEGRQLENHVGEEFDTHHLEEYAQTSAALEKATSALAQLEGELSRRSETASAHLVNN